MDKDYFIGLLNKYRKGNITIEEQQFLLSYYQHFDAEPNVIALLDEMQIESLKNEIEGNIWSNIEQHEEQNQKWKRDRLRWVARIGTAASLVIVLTSGLFFLNDKPKNKVSSVTKKELVKEHRLIRLPDGSTVIIGSGSKLNYPSSFDGLAKREVYLNGQAYFDVKHNSEKPFIIHTGKVATTVLGTAFNVKAWADEEDIVVTVTRGKVRVDDDKGTLGTITPNQQISYHKQNAGVVQTNVEARDFLAWKDQDLLLDNVTVAEAAELLEDRFKVKIQITDEQIKTIRFSTTFLKEEGLEQVLKSICEFNGTLYTYDQANSYVSISFKD